MIGIIITGLTGSGKTEVAFNVARKIGGEVINLDRTFTWKYFPLSSGMSDVHGQKNVERHLYEFLEPDQDLIPNDVFAGMVLSKAREIISRGKVPIVEGGSPKYFKDLYFLNKVEKVFGLLVNLTYPKMVNINEKILNRIEKVIDLGLVDEIKNNLQKYRDTQFMKEGKFVVPIVEYIDGKIDLNTAKDNMVEGVNDLINYQKEEFSNYEDLIIIENKDTEGSVSRIVGLWESLK